MTRNTRRRTAHLRRGGTSVVVDLTAPGAPAIAHWGADLGELTDGQAADLCRASRPQRVSGSFDRPPRLTLAPLESEGWLGPQCVTGQGAGAPCPRFTLVACAASERGATFELADPEAGLGLTAQLELSEAGLLRQRLTVRNDGAEAYALGSLTMFFPLPDDAVELLDTTGRHLRERAPQRHRLAFGAHVRESRRGRPGADASLMIAAGRPGFGFERGRAHAVHLAWSGNHRLSAERTTTGEAFLTAAELLNPGEIRLAPGQRHSTPWALGSWGDGLTQLAGRFHAELRQRHGPTPRPVTFNTWEAVYFDQSPGRLAHLAKAAAAVGAERFVLDDGWFRGRRDDTAGLGDWVADGAKWPLGLLPLAHQVRSLGMEFGLWVEPEMVNPDSDLARAHPDWILRGRSENPPSARHQQALDLANPRAYAHIAERLHALVGELGVAYLKWDHNRDLACAYAGGQARVHANVEALYRLMDGLRAAHPGLAIESCASGGARVDLGILGRANRIWPSDCIDPLERLAIQKYTGLLAPPEFMGAHLTASPVHSTGRAASLALSGGVALFGHFGIERDLTACGAEELAEITRWVALHKQWREQIAAGRMVHADLADPSLDVRGIVGPERRRALFAVTQMATGASYPAARFPLPGLDPAATYQVRAIFPPDAGGEPAQSRLAWIAEPVSLTGRQLGQVGLRAPVQFPGGLTLIEALALPGPTPTTPHNREGES